MKDDDSMMFFGGIATLVVIGALIVDWLKKLVIKIELLFNAIGKAAMAFGAMIKGVAFVSMYLALICISFYCIYWYISTLKRAHNVERNLKLIIKDELREQRQELKRFISEGAEYLEQLSNRIEAALKPVEVKPDLKALIGKVEYSKSEDLNSSHDDGVAPVNPY